MLHIEIPESELYDEGRNIFIKAFKGQSLTLEHSLVSLSKWESKWCVSFLATEKKTREQTESYVQCMTLTQNVDPAVYKYLTRHNIEEVNNYILEPMTATTFTNHEPTKINNDIITAEIIYYWMIVFQIPFECQKWHLNRLLSLINVCNIKSKPAKKMTLQERIAMQQKINAARRAKFNSKG